VNRRVAHFFMAFGVLIAVMCPLSASAVTIDFDTFIPSTIITDQYGSLGVIFPRQPADPSYRTTVKPARDLISL
jgi:hypothetical protein